MTPINTEPLAVPPGWGLSPHPADASGQTWRLYWCDSMVWADTKVECIARAWASFREREPEWAAWIDARRAEAGSEPDGIHRAEGQ